MNSTLQPKHGLGGKSLKEAQNAFNKEYSTGESGYNHRHRRRPYQVEKEGDHRVVVSFHPGLYNSKDVEKEIGLLLTKLSLSEAAWVDKSSEFNRGYIIIVINKTEVSCVGRAQAKIYDALLELLSQLEPVPLPNP